MKKEYISPEIEIQKFSFEAILNGGTDDPEMRYSTGENTGYESNGEEELG
ncbi:MAG: hypothetical protein ACI4HK_02005 [Ruminococcus sp.]